LLSKDSGTDVNISPTSMTGGDRDCLKSFNRRGFKNLCGFCFALFTTSVPRLGETGWLKEETYTGFSTSAGFL
jgi:hypothetical protein